MCNECAMLSSGRSLRATVVCLYNKDCMYNHMIRFWSIFCSRIEHLVCNGFQPWKWGLRDPSFHHLELQHHVARGKVSWVCLHVGACPTIPLIGKDSMCQMGPWWDWLKFIFQISRLQNMIVGLLIDLLKVWKMSDVIHRNSIFFALQAGRTVQQSLPLLFV